MALMGNAAQSYVRHSQVLCPPLQHEHHKTNHRLTLVSSLLQQHSKVVHFTLIAKNFPRFRYLVKHIFCTFV